MSLPKGLGARKYASYRPTRHGDVAIAITNEDEATVETLNAIASGDTEILAARGAAENLVIKGLSFSNADSSKVTVSVKAGEGGLEKFKTCLTKDGGSIDFNLTGRYWRLPLNQPLIVVLSGASDVFITVEYEGEDEPGEEAVTLTDSIDIAEAKVIGIGEVLADTQTITEAINEKAVVVNESETVTLAEADTKEVITAPTDSMTVAEETAKSVGQPLADSQTITEALVNTPGVVLSDSESITEAVANQTTLSLNDSQAIIDSNLVITYTPGP